MFHTCKGEENTKIEKSNSFGRRWGRTRNSSLNARALGVGGDGQTDGQTETNLKQVYCLEDGHEISGGTGSVSFWNSENELFGSGSGQSAQVWLVQ